MSNLRTNINDTLAAARLRATRSGDTLRSLLSPAVPGAVAARPPGVTFATLGRQMAGLSTSVGSAESDGATGEFSLRTGSASGLSIFVLDPDSLGSLCLGSVNGGVKFCLASGDKCSVGAHAKKVDVHPSHVYINAGRNAAYTDPHVSSTAFGSALPNLMGELHPHEDWLRIFQGFLDDSISEVPTGTLVTPRKRKFRYLPDPIDIPAVGDSPITSLTSWDAEQPELTKNMVNALQKLENRFADFQMAVGEDVDALFSKLQDLKAVVGVKPVSLPIDGFYEDCVTIWETLAMLSGCQPDMSKLQQLEVGVQTLQNTTAAFGNKLQTLETGHSELSELGQLLNFEYDQLQQVVQRLGSGGSSLSSVAMDELLLLQHQVSSLMQSGSTDSHDYGTLKAQIKLIEARLPSDAFVIGGQTFNSKADVALFIEKELSGLSFSLFHDPITCWNQFRMDRRKNRMLWRQCIKQAELVLMKTKLLTSTLLN
jgi:hypothetical protein